MMMGFYTPSGHIRPHLRFNKLPLEKGRKMHVYEMINMIFNEKVGVIHWRGGWRQYVSRTNPNVDMSQAAIKKPMISWMT